MELTIICAKEDKYFYRNGEDNWTVKALRNYEKASRSSR